MKKQLLVILIFLVSIASTYAEKITKVGVIDMTLIYGAFYKDSQPVRELEAEREMVQKKLDEMKEQIRILSEEKMEAENNGNDNLAVLKEEEIFKAKELYRNYARTMQAKLKAQLANLLESSSFYNEILEEIEFVSQSLGFSLIIQKGSSGSEIVWYAQDVDITDAVLKRLSDR